MNVLTVTLWNLWTTTINEHSSILHISPHFLCSELLERKKDRQRGVNFFFFFFFFAITWNLKESRVGMNNNNGVNIYPSIECSLSMGRLGLIVFTISPVPKSYTDENWRHKDVHDCLAKVPSITAPLVNDNLSFCWYHTEWMCTSLRVMFYILDGDTSSLSMFLKSVYQMDERMERGREKEK